MVRERTYSGHFSTLSGVLKILIDFFHAQSPGRIGIKRAEVANGSCVDQVPDSAKVALRQLGKAGFRLAALLTAIFEPQ